jgi:hypothetical protein
MFANVLGRVSHSLTGNLGIVLQRSSGPTSRLFNYLLGPAHLLRNIAPGEVKVADIASQQQGSEEGQLGHSQHRTQQKDK